MTDTESIEALSFEEAFTTLESVINALEQEQRPLEEILSLFGRGQQLARRCADLLDQADLRVKQLQGDGTLVDAGIKPAE